jgi:Metallo-beta-lactamase superfamily
VLHSVLTSRGVCSVPFIRAIGRWTMIALVINSIIGSGFGQTNPAASRVTGLPQSVRLYVFDCGTLHITNTERFGLKREEVATADLSVPCFLIVHPKGTLIWDTGTVPDAAWTPVGHPVVQQVVLPDSQERDVTVVNSLRAQLAEVGYSPSDITYLALSHYHYDHTANANEFAASTWLVAKSNVTLCSLKNLPARHNLPRIQPSGRAKH